MTRDSYRVTAAVDKLDKVLVDKVLMIIHTISKAYKDTTLSAAQGTDFVQYIWETVLAKGLCEMSEDVKVWYSRFGIE